ncbi:MAG: methylenetetrahydromethanopterin dehydrogenase [Synergistales bacterium]|nr:methylenetetrahydromethanopterin dehydrogenase [Synergistales bacterium]
MKKILLQLDTDIQPSVFDAVTAYDGGADALLQHGGITPENAVPLVHGVMFTRGGEKSKNSAVFVGGSDVAAGEAVMEAVKGAFFGPVRNSVMLDSNGCNTTAAAAVAKLVGVADVKDRKVVVLAGTGPVGQRAAGFFAGEGARVTLTSRSMEKAQRACDQVNRRFDSNVEAAEVNDEASTAAVLEGAVAVLATGAAGTMLLPESIWKGHATLKALGDLNAVPPSGIENIKPHWNGKDKDGQIIFGPIGVGGLKMKVQRECVARLFGSNELVLDAGEVYDIVKELKND